jgi:hypothetical protein
MTSSLADGGFSNDTTVQDGKAYQLALSLFNDLAPQGATAESLPSKVGFHKNNLFINIVDLSLSARRAIDVLYFITAQDREVQPIYRVDLDVFKWLMGYSSNNRKHLQSVLREGQKAAVQIQSSASDGQGGERWASIPMLGPVAIANGRVHFEIHSRLQTEIKSPAASHFLSLRYVFKSIHAKILFDRLQLHVDEGLTPWIGLEELRTWWGFKDDEYAEFKKMRQRVIEKAVTQINEVTGLRVTYDTKNTPGSKRVASIRFHVQRTPDYDSPQASMVALKAQYDVLRNEFGLNSAQLEDILSHRDEWNDDRVDKAIEYTRYQLTKGKVKHNVAGYLIKAIYDGYVLGEAQKQLETVPVHVTTTAAPALENAVAEHERQRLDKVQRLSKAGEAGYAAFLSMEPDRRETVLLEFSMSLAAKTLAIQLGVESVALPELVAESAEIQNQLGAFVALRSTSASRRRRFSPDLP